MKKGNKIGKLQVATLVALGVVNAGPKVLATEHDLSGVGTDTISVVGQFGGTAIFSDYFEQPTGTGVFDPFLTLDANGKTSTSKKYIESAYNSDGHNDLYLDGHRPSWNTHITVGDLASIKIGNINYFAFILDANEPGNDKSIISVDNIRIYTSKTDTTGLVKDDITKLNSLGTLRWAMNDPLSTGTTPPDIDGFNVEQWVKLDAAQENVEQGNSNGGSGKGDMVVYIPQDAFGDSVGTDDFVWFYNLNGVHYSVDKDLGSTAGFEEWRAVVGPQSVPDNGGTLALFGSAILGLGFVARRMAVRKA